MNQLSLSSPVESFGRYVLHPPIARGGMATVHPARLLAAEGFNRLVAAKRLHPELTEDPDFVEMFHDEARIASKIHHPNVVPVLDVIMSGQEVILVQEYVHGVPLSQLLKIAISEGEPLPCEIVVAVVAGVLAGLHAAHEATDEQGEPLSIVHRDVSPQNVLVSIDGIPRLLDFGIAKARTSSHHTREGILKGKLAYMSAEQLRSENVTRRADVYAVGVVMWELLTNKRFHDGKTDIELVAAIAKGDAPALTDAVGDAFLSGERHAQLSALEPIVSRAMATAAEDRYPTAAAMLDAILAAGPPPASATEVGQWVRTSAADYLERRQRVLASNEESWRRISQMPLVIPTESSGVKIAGSHPPDPVVLSAPPEAMERRHDASRLVPWAMAAALLMMVGVLVGMVAVKNHVSEPVQAVQAVQASPPPHAAVAMQLSVPSAPVEAVHVEPPPAPPVSAKAAPPTTIVRYVALPPPRPAPPPVATTQAPASQPSASPKSDCNPPFYFDGSKKVFKPSCL